MTDLTITHRRNIATRCLPTLVLAALLLVPAFGQVVSTVCDRL